MNERRNHKSNMRFVEKSFVMFYAARLIEAPEVSASDYNGGNRIRTDALIALSTKFPRIEIVVHKNQ